MIGIAIRCDCPGGRPSPTLDPCGCRADRPHGHAPLQGRRPPVRGARARQLRRDLAIPTLVPKQEDALLRGHDRHPATGHDQPWSFREGRWRPIRREGRAALPSPIEKAAWPRLRRAGAGGANWLNTRLAFPLDHRAAPVAFVRWLRYEVSRPYGSQFPSEISPCTISTVEKGRLGSLVVDNERAVRDAVRIEIEQSKR